MVDRCALLLIVVGCVLGVDPAAAELPIQIAEPADGAVVFNERFDIRGTATGSSRVVLLIQEADDQVRLWRVVQVAEVEPDGSFRTEVPVQRAELDAGYSVVALAISGTRSMRFEKPGRILRSIPAPFLRSEPVRVTVAGTTRPWAVEQNRTERILFPISGWTVGPTDSIVIEGSGQPKAVVLVRQDSEGSVWYVQNAAVPASPGKTVVRARFGAADTARGTKFRIRLAIPNGLEQSLLFSPGSELRKLPDEVIYGPDVVVLYDPDKEPSVELERMQFQASIAEGRDSIRIVSPLDRARVKRINPVTGFCKPGMAVVLLVRSEEDPTAWYVQSPCKVYANRFQGEVYLGRQGTLAETKFDVIAALVKPPEIASWKPGEALTKIPKDVVLSEMVRLIHNGTDQ